MPETFNKNYVAAGVVIALVLIGGIYYYARRATTAGTPSQTASSTTYSLPGGGGVSVSGGNATVAETSVPAPDYTLPLSFSASLSADVKTALNAQLSTIKGILAKDPTNFNAWVDLGIVRKTAGDYSGAEKVFTYVAAVYPKSPVPFDDLGDLHQNFIKDYAKAESEYLQAIKNSPADLNAYESLFALYTDYGYKSGSEGAALLKQGIANNPKEPFLHVLLARYYVKTGDNADAKVQYDAAVQAAQNANDAAGVQAIQQEEAQQIR